MIKQRTNEEEIVQNRPIEDSQKKGYSKEQIETKANKWNVMERDCKRDNNKKEQYNAQ